MGDSNLKQKSSASRHFPATLEPPRWFTENPVADGTHLRSLKSSDLSKGTSTECWNSAPSGPGGDRRSQTSAGPQQTKRDSTPKNPSRVRSSDVCECTSVRWRILTLRDKQQRKERSTLNKAVPWKHWKCAPSLVEICNCKKEEAQGSHDMKAIFFLLKWRKN